MSLIRGFIGSLRLCEIYALLYTKNRPESPDFPQPQNIPKSNAWGNKYISPFIFSDHDGEEFGSPMMAKIACRTGLKPENF